MNRWICEFCYSTVFESQLPVGWELVFQSVVCPTCQKRVAQEGGYSSVIGGAYAEGKKDPRTIRSLARASQDALQILDHMASAKCRCDESVGFICEACEARRRAFDLREALKNDREEKELLVRALRALVLKFGNAMRYDKEAGRVITMVSQRLFIMERDLKDVS